MALCTAGAVGGVVARRRTVGTTGRPLPAGPVACVVLVLVAGVAVEVDSATRPVGPLGPKIREYALWCSSSWLRVLAARGRVVVGAVVTTTRRTTTTRANSKHSPRKSGSGFAVESTVVSDAPERRQHSSSSSRHHHEDVFVRYCCCCSC